MNARRFSFSPSCLPLLFPPYWIANNDFPHVAAFPGIQCEELQWLPALYFERFSAHLTRRPPRRREISADTRDAFVLKCWYATRKKYSIYLQETLAILLDGAHSTWLKRAATDIDLICIELYVLSEIHNKHILLTWQMFAVTNCIAEILDIDIRYFTTKYFFYTQGIRSQSYHSSHVEQVKLQRKESFNESFFLVAR